MRAVGFLPSLSIVAGAVCAPFIPPLDHLSWLLLAFLAASVVGWWRHSVRLTVACLVGGLWTAAVLLSAQAEREALRPSLRAVLEREVGGFEIATLGPERDHDPILTRAVLTEDASRRDDYVSLRTRVTALRIGKVWRAADGGMTVSVGGAAQEARVLTWTAGRTIEAPMTFRRPERFLNEGVPDFELALAREGTALFGSIKSALLVDVMARGGPVDEFAAGVRAHVRDTVATWIAPHSAVSAAVAAAVLIGDRTGLPDETREALQLAGTYHVIAISGGNIAIVAVGASVLFALVGIRGRWGALLIIIVLTAFATIVTAGPSVWRATLMAVAYFAARVIDHRTPVWQAMALAAALILIITPLDIADPGFVLTFGATMALVEGARRAAGVVSAGSSAGLQSKTRPTGSWVWSWLLATVVASVAVEVALLPVSAWQFSRVTSAGLVLNLLAVPAMGVVQVAAMVVTVANDIPWVAFSAGWVAHHAADALLSSADLVAKAPWLAARVPPPTFVLVVAYYVALCGALTMRRAWRAGSAVVFVVALVAIVSGTDILARGRGSRAERSLRLTLFDVGQGESMLLEAGDRSWLVDTGGPPFGGGLDIGRRVLAPALWARGFRSLDALLVTHGDPDHLGGALAVADDFRPGAIWEGIRVPRHLPTETLLDQAERLRIPVAPLRAGQVFDHGGVQVRVLHPPPPDWERRRVRNDDSVVLEVVAGDVAILLTGDISAEIERAILPQLTASRIRTLKVAHHGSRTSSSETLLEGWRPQIAVISAGRGNRFGHPAPEVLQRLEAIGAAVFRTDLEGEITIETDGQSLRIGTYRRTSE